MARVDIDEIAVNMMVQRMLMERARLALEIYTAKKLEYDSSDYPFARHDQRSIRDPDSQSATPLGAAGVRIAVTAAAARFIEHGNGTSLIRPRNKRALKIDAAGGGVFFFDHVKPYKGTNRLWESVREAFRGIVPA